MSKLFLMQRAGKWLAVAVAAMLSFGLAMAQSEPTLNQIYQAAQSGKVDQAQVMMQQVLIAHPNSAKAHFVQAELFARQGQASRARESLLAADKLAPGLPFAKPDAVQALRTQLASNSVQPVGKDPASKPFGSVVGADTALPAASASPFPLGLGLAFGAAAIALVVFLIRRKPAAAPASQAAYADPAGNFGASSGVDPGARPATMGSGLSGPQTFGAAGTVAAMPAYGQPGYGQAPASGMGGRVMGGLATGLAVGAGVMAAQAIGKNLMGNNEQSAHPSDGAASNANQPLAGNNDQGGQDFGVNDASSWDDGSAGSDMGGGGGDWDT